MDLLNYQRTVFAFHDYDRRVRDVVGLGQQMLLAGFNTYGWLGMAIYFWEHRPRRALKCAAPQSRRKHRNIQQSNVPRAVIRLGIALIGCTIFSGCVKQSQPVKLVDQAALARVAIESNDPVVARIAVERIIDQPILARVACVGKSADVRSAAVAKITDPVVLGTIEMGRRLADVKTQTDQRLLAEAAITGRDLDICLAAVEKLSDQEMLTKVAKGALFPAVKCAAVKRPTNQELLVNFALENEDVFVRNAAVATISDQILLAKLAIDPTDFVCSREAVAKLEDCDLLLKVASEAKDYEVVKTAKARKKALLLIGRPSGAELAVKELDAFFQRRKEAQSPTTRLFTSHPPPLVEEDFEEYWKAVVGKTADQKLLGRLASQIFFSEVSLSSVAKLSDQDVLAAIALREEYESIRPQLAQKTHDIRVAAVTKVVSPAKLAEVTMRVKDSTVRSIALLGFQSHNLNDELIWNERDVDVRRTAILLHPNQEGLKKLAIDCPTTALREAALIGISDDLFLMARARVDPRPSCRAAAVRGLTSHEATEKTAVEGYFQNVREAAIKRLDCVGKDRVNELATKRDKAIKDSLDSLKTVNETELAGFAVRGNFDVVCRAALARIREPEALMRVTLETHDEEIRKAAFNSLNDQSLIELIADSSSDPALRIAASIKSSRQSWGDVFQMNAHDPAKLGDALAAVALFTSVQTSTKDGIELACVELIKIGDRRRVYEMADLLETYGSKQLAEDYLNSGDAELEMAGVAWGRRRGFTISKGTGSHRATWGEKS